MFGLSREKIKKLIKEAIDENQRPGLVDHLELELILDPIYKQLFKIQHREISDLTLEVSNLRSQLKNLCQVVEEKL